MGALGLIFLLLAADSVEVLLVLDCVSSLNVECVLSSAGSIQVDFCKVLVGSLHSLDSLHAGDSGLDSGLDSASGLSAASLAVA